MEEYIKEANNYSLSNWYSKFEDVTFKSRVVQIDVKNLKRILKCKQFKKNLLKQIKEIIDEFEFVFIRLEELSPKYFSPIDDELIVCEILQTDRTKEVIQEYVKQNKPCNLWIRKFTNTDDFFEFRIFTNGKITAISQNDANKDSETMTCDPNEIIKIALLVYEMVKDLFHNPTIDIMIKNDLSEWYLVEINTPHDKYAGLSLFDGDNHLVELVDNFIRFRYYTDYFYSYTDYLFERLND